MGSELTRYSDLLTDIKTRIRQAQTRAVMSASAEMIMMYWDIGLNDSLNRRHSGTNHRRLTRSPRLHSSIDYCSPEEYECIELNSERIPRCLSEQSGDPLSAGRRG
jgi:hypothetical protein